MNTQHFVYALEVEKTGSITQAAENLFMSQPTLSKAIKDLETALGFTVFQRSARGVVPTRKGSDFLGYARRIVAQIDRMEMALQAKDASRQLFSLALPRVSYMAQAAADVAASFGDCRDLEIDRLEGSAMEVIEAVAYGHHVLGLLRCHGEDAEFFRRSLWEKGLKGETIWEGDYVVTVRRGAELDQGDTISMEKLRRGTEVTFAMEEVPYVQMSQAKSGPGRLRSGGRRVLVNSGAMAAELLRRVPDAYVWTSPLTQDQLQRLDLAQLSCPQGGRFLDLLISRSSYRYSDLDRRFLDALFCRRNAAAYGP